MTKQVKIYHNPRCSTSWETLNLLTENPASRGGALPGPPRRCGNAA